MTDTFEYPAEVVRARVEERRQLEAENERLRQLVSAGEDQVYMLERRVYALESAADSVCAFDWSDNDPDAVRAIDGLREVLSFEWHREPPYNR